MEKPTSPLKAATPAFCVRPATDDDIVICSRLDASYNTDYVWQMVFEEGDRTVQSTFTQVRLPRTMAVSYPHASDNLFDLLERVDCLLVASYSDDVVGYISGILEPWRNTCVIPAFVIHPQARRKGVGKRLLKMVIAWATHQDCKQITFTAQTKNHPAIQFAKRYGFVLCGYNDRYFLNGDIALTFSLTL